MAQASSAQREPSMEEILASIRRIIEDNDAADRGRASAPEAAPAEQPPRKVIEVDAFRGETRVQQPPAQPEREPEAREIHRQTQYASEVQAQLAAEAAAIPSRWDDAPQERHSYAEQAAEERRTPDDIMTAIANSRAAREDVRALLGIPEPANTARAPESHARPEDADVRRSVLESIFHERAEAAPAAQKPVETKPTAKNSPDSIPLGAGLISKQAERQVVASFAELSEAFNELSEAFAERSRKSFDDMAEQMMAPLLREWMDNNLPTIVERLVREEIERVARGVQ